MSAPRPGSSRFAGGPKNASLAATTVPPFSIAARSTEPAPQNASGSGITRPNTRRRATPPSGWMCSRTCVARADGDAGSSTLAWSGCTAVRGRTGTHTRPPGASPPASSAATGSASSSSTDSIAPGVPRRTITKSWPGVRRRCDSQPSIHLPRSVYAPSRHSGAAGRTSASLGAK